MGNTFKLIFLFTIVNLSFLSCDFNKKDNIEICKKSSNKIKNNDRAIIIVDNPLEMNLAFKYNNIKGLHQYNSSAKKDTLHIVLNNRSYLSIMDLGLKKGNPYLGYNINIFPKDTLYVMNSLKKDSVFFSNRSIYRYRINEVYKGNEKLVDIIDSLELIFGKNRRNIKVVNQKSIDHLLKLKLENILYQQRYIDSILPKADNKMYLTALKEEINYKLYAQMYRYYSWFGASFLAKKFYSKKIIEEKILSDNPFRLDYLNLFVNFISTKITEDRPLLYYKGKYDTLTNFFKGKELKLARQMLINKMSNDNPQLQREYYAKYMGDYQDTIFKSYYFKQLNNSNDNPEETKNVEIFNNRKLHVKSISLETHYLDKILKKNKGKVVYVDFWASWCVPCRLAFPKAKELIKEYKDKNFVYIYLSIDRIPSKWYSAIKEENITSFNHNYILEEDMNNVFLKALEVKFIPRYIIFNKEGKLVESNAPGPDNKEIKLLLNKYLNE